jgi:phenylacetate-coenzyme A ligase PaaK-like adenylate-forming protein
MAAKDYFDELETMSPMEREHYQSEKLRETMRHAYRYAPAIKELCDNAGVDPEAILAVGDLEKLPVTRKEELIARQRAHPPYGGYETIDHKDIARVFISPGPLYEPNFTLDVKFFARSFWAAGFRRGDIVLNTFTYHLSPAGHVMQEGARDCGATVIPTGTGSTDAQLETMRDLGVSAYVGTPSYLMAIIKKAEESGYQFRRDFHLKRAWFTGEMLAPSTRRTLAEDYGVDTFQSYAVTELGGALTYECSVKKGMHLSDEYIIEIVDPATGRQLAPGEVGEIVVTPINNPTWCPVRYGTGDLASITVEPCACGRTSSRLVAIVGRAGDAVKVRGMFVVAKQAEQVCAAFSDISRFQIVVTREQERDRMTVKVELKTKGTGGDALAAELGQKFQDVCRVRADRIDFVSPGSLPADAKTIDDRRKWD